MPARPLSLRAARAARDTLRRSLGMFFGVHVFFATVLLVVAFEETKSHPEFYFGSLIAGGFVAAQAALLGLWAMLGSQRWTDRVPIVLGLLGLLTIAATAAMDQMYGLVYCLVPFLATLPLLVIRIGFPWRLVPPELLATPRGQQPTQFGVRRLLLWITGIAVLLAMARAVLLPKLPLAWIGFDLPFSISGAMYATAVVWVLAAVVLWSERRFSPLARIVAVVFLVIMGLSLPLSIFVIHLCGTPLVAVLLSLLWLRKIGYRIRRPPAELPQETAEPVEVSLP